MITVQPSKNIKDGIAKLIAASIEDYNRDTNNEKMKEEFANSIIRFDVILSGSLSQGAPAI